MNSLDAEISRRRTFAIISHPDAGKTTITEHILLSGGVIKQAGTVKAKKSSHYATSDWIKIEKERGISVASSVIQFEYNDTIINLLDTPGHADFSEDTYRTLTAVDCALMVIDAAKGIESRTLKLMEVCQLRNTPIITFINKLDREGRYPIELIDEIEDKLSIQCAAVTWPIGMGNNLQGIYHLYDNYIRIYNKFTKTQHNRIIEKLESQESKALLAEQIDIVKDEIELIQQAGTQFNLQDFLKGEQTPVFFGSALHNFGIDEFLNYLTRYAPMPQSRIAKQRTVMPNEAQLTGFVFKIQANMDAAHRDRIAFLRICSGQYKKGMQLKHLRIGRNIQTTKALTFMAEHRMQTEYAYAGDIIGLHNHGTISIGDTFTEGENLSFTGIPFFAPELFMQVSSKDPLKIKALWKGLSQLCEEGATQIFRPLDNNALILGAIGVLQFDVVKERLKTEYNVQCAYHNIPIATARWVSCNDTKKLQKFKEKAAANLAQDGGNKLVYLAPSLVHMEITAEKWLDIQFEKTCEHSQD